MNGFKKFDGPVPAARYRSNAGDAVQAFADSGDTCWACKYESESEARQNYTCAWNAARAHDGVKVRKRGLTVFLVREGAEQ